MRIAHVTECYLPRLGGIEVHVARLAAEQSAAGDSVEVWTPTRAEGAEDAGGPVVRRLRGGPAGVVDELAGWLDGTTGRPPDVLHAHVSVVSPVTTAAVWLAVRRGLPVTVTIHSMWGHLRPLPLVAATVMGLSRWPIVWTAVSQAAAAPLREMLGPDVPVQVLHNAVDVGWWSALPDQEDGLLVSSVLRFARTKKPHDLIRILARTRQALPAQIPLRAVLVGEGPLWPSVRREADRLGGWVEFPGRRPPEQVRALLSRSSAYLSPSPWESFGIAALEARAAGVPVVAHSASGVGDVVVNGVEGLLAEGVGGMTGALTRLLTDRALRERMRRHNRLHPPPHTWTRAVQESRLRYADAARLLSQRERDRVAARRR